MLANRCFRAQRKVLWITKDLSRRKFSVQPLRKNTSANDHVTDEEVIDHDESSRVHSIFT
jgi:hypothetical protein